MAPLLFEMTDAELDHEIAALYRWFAKQAPGVSPQETGRLAALWAEFDRRQP